MGKVILRFSNRFLEKNTDMLVLKCSWNGIELKFLKNCNNFQLRCIFDTCML